MIILYGVHSVRIRDFDLQPLTFNLIQSLINRAESGAHCALRFESTMSYVNRSALPSASAADLADGMRQQLSPDGFCRSPPPCDHSRAALLNSMAMSNFVQPVLSKLGKVKAPIVRSAPYFIFDSGTDANNFSTTSKE